MIIFIYGSTASGKTTLANKLSKHYGINYLDCDTIAFKEEGNFELDTKENVIKRYNDFKSENKDYIITGNFSSIFGDTILESADVILIMNISYIANMYRATKRTLYRTIFKPKLHGNNVETWSNFFSKENMILWVHKTYKNRKQQAETLRKKYKYIDVHRGYDLVKIVTEIDDLNVNEM